MQPKPRCPGCNKELDVVAASGRADDLYLCSRCYHSWFRFELGEDEFTSIDSLNLKNKQP